MYIEEENLRYSVKINSQVAYDPLAILGSGAHGFVAQGVIKKDIFKQVAVKRLHKAGKLLKKKHIAFQREISLLKKLDNPFILKLQLFHIDQKDIVYIVTERCRSNLHTEIQKGSFSFNRVFKYSYQIIYAMKYMHSMNCIHRDLKPENIFLTSEDNVKIGDLGIAKQILDENIEKFKTHTENIGTAIYSSPQMILENKSNDKHDVWSVGCIIYEMLTSKRLFISQNGESVVEIHKKFKQNKKECLKIIQDPFWHEIIDKMLTFQHQNRPNFQQLLKIFAYTVGNVLKRIKQSILQIKKQNDPNLIFELYKIQTQLENLVDRQLRDLLSTNSISQFLAIRESIQETKSSRQTFGKTQKKFMKDKSFLKKEEQIKYKKSEQFIDNCEVKPETERFVKQSLNQGINIQEDDAQQLIKIINWEGKSSQNVKKYIKENIGDMFQQKLVKFIDLFFSEQKKHPKEEIIQKIVQIKKWLKQKEFIKQQDTQKIIEKAFEKKEYTEQIRKYKKKDKAIQNFDNELKTKMQWLFNEYQHNQASKQLIETILQEGDKKGMRREYFRLDESDNATIESEEKQIILVVISTEKSSFFKILYKFQQQSTDQKILQANALYSQLSNANQHYHLVRLLIKFEQSIIYLRIGSRYERKFWFTTNPWSDQHLFSSQWQRIDINQGFGFSIMLDNKIKQLDQLRIVNSCLLFLTHDKSIFKEKLYKDVTTRFNCLFQLSGYFCDKNIDQSVLRKTIRIKINSVDNLRYILYLLIPFCQQPELINQRIENEQQLMLIIGKYRKMVPINENHQRLELLYLNAISKYLIEHNDLWKKDKQGKQIVISYVLQSLENNKKRYAVQFLKIVLSKFRELIWNDKFNDIIKERLLLNPREYFIKLLQTADLVEKNQNKSQNIENTDSFQEIAKLLKQFLLMTKLWENKNPKSASFPNTGIFQYQFKKISNIMENIQFIQDFQIVPEYLKFWKSCEILLYEIGQLDPQFVNYWRKKTIKGYESSIKAILKNNSQIILELLLQITDKQERKKLSQRLMQQSDFMPKNFKKIIQKSLILFPDRESMSDKKQEFKHVVSELVFKFAKYFDAYEMAVLANDKNDFISKLIEDLLQNRCIEFIIKTQTGTIQEKDYLNLGQKCYQFPQNSKIHELITKKYWDFLHKDKSINQMKDLAIKLIRNAYARKEGEAGEMSQHYINMLNEI